VEKGVESSLLLKINQLDGFRRSMIMTFPTIQEKDQVLTKFQQIAKVIRKNIRFAEFMNIESELSPMFEGQLIFKDPTLNKFVLFEAKLIAKGLLLYITRVCVFLSLSS